MIDLSDLLARWTGDEARFRDYGQDEVADVIARCRSDLAEYAREWQLEALTLEEAAAFSGLARGTLSNKIARGELPNAGSKGRPRVRRGDLPMKPPGSPGRGEAIDLADRILRSRA